jgi:hypothetical protein
LYSSELQRGSLGGRLGRGAAGFVYPHFLMPLRSKNCGFTSVRMGWHNGGTAQWAAASNPP